jgi:hypothetical protein
METDLSQFILSSLQRRNRIQTKPFQLLIQNCIYYIDNSLYESNKNLVQLCNNYSKEEAKERIKRG